MKTSPPYLTGASFSVFPRSALDEKYLPIGLGRLLRSLVYQLTKSPFTCLSCLIPLSIWKARAPVRGHSISLYIWVQTKGRASLWDLLSSLLALIPMAAFYSLFEGRVKEMLRDMVINKSRIEKT